MINYMKSENYRLLHKKSLYLTSFVCLFIIAAAASILYFSHQSDPSFPYGTSNFLYSNVLGFGMFVILVSFLFNLFLTGKDSSIMKQSVSFGISRSTIFWSKFILTLSYFLILCGISFLLIIALGETFLISEGEAVKNFLIACLNMLPIIISAFCIIHVLRMLYVSEVYIIIVLVPIYILSEEILRVLFRPFASLDALYPYAPSAILNENLMQYMNLAVSFDHRAWITGIIISVITLFIGSRRFKKQNIN